MDKVLGRYEYGKDKVPDWLREEMSRGRGRIEYEDGVPVRAVIYTVGGTKVLHKGDVVLKLKTGMTVLPKAAADRYMKEREATEYVTE